MLKVKLTRWLDFLNLLLKMRFALQYKNRSTTYILHYKADSVSRKKKKKKGSPEQKNKKKKTHRSPEKKNKMKEKKRGYKGK